MTKTTHSAPEIERLRAFVLEVFEDKACQCEGEPFDIPRFRCPCFGDDCWKCAAAILLGWPGVTP